MPQLDPNIILYVFSLVLLVLLFIWYSWIFLLLPFFITSGFIYKKFSFLLTIFLYFSNMVILSISLDKVSFNFWDLVLININNIYLFKFLSSIVISYLKCIFDRIFLLYNILWFISINK